MHAAVNMRRHLLSMAKHEACIATILRKSALIDRVQIMARHERFARNSPYPRHFFALRGQFDLS
jgi:hypothetical protein